MGKEGGRDRWEERERRDRRDKETETRRLRERRRKGAVEKNKLAPSSYSEPPPAPKL